MVSDGLDRSIFSSDVLARLASRLLTLYDVDVVVDREEYKSLVRDMVRLGRVRRIEMKKMRERKRVRRRKRDLLLETRPASWGRSVGEAIKLRLHGRKEPKKEVVRVMREKTDGTKEKMEKVQKDGGNGGLVAKEKGKGVTCTGSVVFEDLKLDLRRWVVGGIPIVKSVRFILSEFLRFVCLFLFF